ncbi:uncharacterized protein LOC131436677 [Malaya genurostris]|uniref:uncharacterized protein LOC131436677 n=1 Tax=Malaya genurostris TaxID=325434 RepID=UPI0026F3D0CF|nr:uncharacterized protein LOC131436677 [Malaya genurostris]
MVKTEKHSSFERSEFNRMVKTEELSSNEDSDDESDGDFSQNPLAFSTQQSPRKQRSEDNSDVEKSDSFEGYHQGSPSNVPLTSKAVLDTMQKYLVKCPNVRVRKLKYNVNVDLSDPDDEVWIVKCPVSIDAKKHLMNAKLSSSFEQISQIESTNTSFQLEGFVNKNSSQKPVTVLSGAEFKSFVPIGTIQIREALESIDAPSQIEQTSVHGEVPFPELIRDRHPLLGLHYHSALKLPKHVKKSLLLARQQASKCYLSSGRCTAIDGKRKRIGNEGLSAECTSTEMAQLLDKDKLQSPEKKKAKKQKRKSIIEDDLSWLQNI